jgi:hypothetical protein
VRHSDTFGPLGSEELELEMEFSKGQTAYAIENAHAARPSSPSTDGNLVALVRRYLKTWGLSDAAVAQIAAERLVAEVAAMPVNRASADVKKTLVALTRSWVEAFARDGADSGDWFWRAQTLLARYPQTFLATAIPREASTRPLDLLPETMPRLMMQQHIIDPLERLTGAVRDARERLRSAELTPEPRPLIEPSP